MISPTTLKTFSLVMKVGSFADAGRELGYTGSAVSQQISSLENVLGLQLFEREAQKIRPTNAAVYLRERAEELLVLLNEVETDAKRLAAGQVGRIRIGSFPSGNELLSQAIARFLVRRRDVEISLEEGEPYELFARLIRGEVDVALGFRYDMNPLDWPDELAVTFLVAEPLHLFVSRKHRLAGKQQVELHDLKGEVWISPREETAAYTCLVLRTAQAGFMPNIAFRINSFDAVRGLVRAGLGVAMIPNLGMSADHEIVSLPIVGGLPTRQVVIVTRKQHINPLVTAFVDAARQIAEDWNDRVSLR